MASVVRLNIDQLDHEQAVIAYLRYMLQVRTLKMSDLLAITPEGRYGELRGLVDQGLYLLAQVPRAQGPLQPLGGLQLERAYPTLQPSSSNHISKYQALFVIYNGLYGFNGLMAEAHSILLDETTAADLPVLIRILEELQYGFYAHITETDGVVVGEPV